MFTVESMGGETIFASFEDLDEAVADAKTRLEDDPELGSVEMYEYAPGIDPRAETDDGGRYVGQAAHVPDRDWQSAVGWLWASEKPAPPRPVPRPIPLDEFEELVNPLSSPYAHDFGKREGMLRMREAGWY